MRAGNAAGITAGMREALLDALGVDAALTVGQAAALAGVPREAVGRVMGPWGMIRVRPIRPTADSAAVPTALAVLTDRGAALAQQRLGRSVLSAAVALGHEVEHVLGVAHLRHRLAVPPERWTTAAELLAARVRVNGKGRGLPDGVAAINGQRIAVEYDFGNYTNDQIRIKQRTVGAVADAVIWGAPTARRCMWLRDRGCGDVRIVQVPR